MAVDQVGRIFDALSESEKQECSSRPSFALTIAARALHAIEPRVAHRRLVGLDEARHQLTQHVGHRLHGAPSCDHDRLCYMVLDQARAFGGLALASTCAGSVLQPMGADHPASQAT